MKKRILTFALAALFAFALIPSAAHAADNMYVTLNGRQHSTTATSFHLGSSVATNECIAQLRYMVNLTSLTLRVGGSQVTDITPLAGLTNLTRLDLGLANTYITDIAPMAGLTNLTSLWVRNNQITDWSPVAHVERVLGRP